MRNYFCNSAAIDLPHWMYSNKLRETLSITMPRFFTPFRIVLIFIALALFSISIIPSLQVELLPASNTSRLQVTVSMPGASALVIEQQVTSVLENNLSQLQGLKQINSVSRSRRGSITLEFDPKTDMQQKLFEVTSLIRQIHPLLPVTASYPLVSGGSESHAEKSPLLVYTINAPQQASVIRQRSQEIFNKLVGGKEGISEVLVTGAPQLQLSVTFNMAQCRSLGKDPAELIATVQSSLTDGFPGHVPVMGGNQYVMHLRAGAANVSSIENMPLALKPPTVIRLKDIATVQLEEQPARQFFRVNGKTNVFATIYARQGGNRILMAQKIKRMIAAPGAWPQGYEASLAFDDSDFLQKELSSNYRRILLSLGILVLFVLITYRNFRHLLTLTSALLISISFTIILVRVAGVPVHLYTIAGMAISFGLILDNLIIMLDYYRQLGNRKVFTAMLASAATVVCALLMVFLLPEQEQNNLHDLALVICFSLVSSLAVALWFVPGLYSLLNKKRMLAPGSISHRKKLINSGLAYAALISFIAKRKFVFCCAVILLFGLPVYLLPREWKGHEWYNETIGSAGWQESAQPVLNRWLGGTSYSFIRNLREKSGFRDPAQNRLFVDAELAPGNTPMQMNLILREVEKYISAETCIDKFVTRVYNGEGGGIEITFKKEYEHTMMPFRLKSRLVTKSLEWGGVDWNIYGVGQAFTNTAAEESGRFSVTLKGYNYDQLEHHAGVLGGILSRNKRVQKINTAEPLNAFDRVTGQYTLTLDERVIALQGANKSAILQEVSKRTPSLIPAGYASIYNNIYPAVLKEKNADDYSAYDLLQRPLVTDSNKMVRLNDFATLAFQPGTNALYKENRQHLRAVGFNFLGPEESGSSYLAKTLDEFNKTLPPGYTAQKSHAGPPPASGIHYSFLVCLLIAAAFFICSMLFESLRQPLLIICTVPVSFLGVFIVFPAGEFFFDQGGYGGFIMLGGLVVSAAIFIVNDFNSLRKKTPAAALHNKMLVKAVANRSRTILLTTLSNICGLVPFLLDGDEQVFWFSFAAATAAGLLFSLLGLFVVLPVLLWKKQYNSL
jgi:multidrug efflux pump subunit AcrB